MESEGGRVEVRDRDGYRRGGAGGRKGRGWLTCPRRMTRWVAVSPAAVSP